MAKCGRFKYELEFVPKPTRQCYAKLKISVILQTKEQFQTVHNKYMDKNMQSSIGYNSYSPPPKKNPENPKSSSHQMESRQTVTFKQ